MLTSWSELSTPAELSMASVLMRPPASAYSMRPRWVKPRLPPSPTTCSAARPRRRAPRRWPCRRPRRGSPRRLHVRADAAVPEQVDRRAQDRLDELGRRQRLGLDAEHRPHLGGERDRLRRAREDAAARRDQLRVVVVPRRARQLEQPLRARAKLAPGRGRGRGRRGGGRTPPTSFMCARQQHAVAEHVAGHVADADDGEVRGLRCRSRARGSGASPTPTRRAR